MENDNSSDTPSSVPPGTPVFGTKRIDVRLNSDKQGVIEIHTDRFEYTFAVDEEQVQEFARVVSEAGPDIALEQPSCIPEHDVSVPDGWENGRVVHTGGGIWNRRFTKPYLGGMIEVAYNVEFLHGVSAGAYNASGEWVGEIAHRELPDDAGEQAALEAANRLMAEIDDGQYPILRD